jgi:hypothetical protein
MPLGVGGGSIGVAGSAVAASEAGILVSGALVLVTMVTGLVPELLRRRTVDRLAATLCELAAKSDHRNDRAAYADRIVALASHIDRPVQPLDIPAPAARRRSARGRQRR